MPEMDGVRATELMRDCVPDVEVIIMSRQGKLDDIRRTMLAGARDYMVKPFSGGELAMAIVRVHTTKKPRVVDPQQILALKNKTITFFSTKGGVGKTVIATNVAVALAQKPSLKVLLLDLDLQFGDGAVFLNVIPQRTIADIGHGGPLKDEEIKACITLHESGLDFLVGSMRPERQKWSISRQ